MAITVAPTSAVDAPGSTVSLTVTSGEVGTFTAVTSDPTATVSPTSFTGSGTVILTLGTFGSSTVTITAPSGLTATCAVTSVGSVIASPGIVTFQSVSDSPKTVFVMQPGNASSTFTVANVGAPVSLAPVPTTPGIYSIAPSASGTGTLSFVGLNGETTLVTVTVGATDLVADNNNPAGLAAQGYIASELLLKVQNRTAEYNIPYGTVLDFLNDGLMDLCARIDPLIQTTSIPVNGGQTLVALPADVQAVKAIFFSATPPFTPGWIPYEMQPLDPKSFAMYASGVPAGPVYAYSYVSDQASQLMIQTTPTPVGFIYVIYSQRPTFFTSAPESYTNVDPMLQLAVVVYACARVAEYVEDFTKKQSYIQEYESKIDLYSSIVRNRRARRPSVVRDVYSTAGQPFPVWWPSQS